MASIKDKIKIEQYIKKANQVEEQYGIPKNLLVGLLKAESGFDPNVISGRRKSSAGALGIAQFMPATAKEFGINPLNPSQAIDAAGRYLSQNYKKLGNWEDTLRSYNMGLGNVYKWKQGKIKLPKETADYVGKVYSNMGAGSNIQMVGDQVRETMNSFIPPTFIPKFVNYGGAGYSSIDTGAEVEEDTKEVLEAKQQIDKVTTEQQIIEDFFAQSQPQQQLAQQEQVQEPQYEVPSLGEQYQQVSQFVDQPIAQQGGVINREAFNKLSKEQQDIIKKEINFNRNWFNRRENTFDKEGKPIPVEKGIFNNVTAFNPKVKSDKEMEEYYAYYSPKTDVTSLRRDFTKFPGTIAHERTHQYQTHMTPENWNKYINLPSAYSMSLNTLMKNARGDEDEFTKYMRDPSEIHSFIQEVRYLNNLDPTVPVTDEMVKKLKYDKSNTLKDYYSDEEIKNFLNSMVSTQPKSYDTIAQQGGRIVTKRKDFKPWWKWASGVAAGGFRRDLHGGLGDLYSYYGGLPLKHNILEYSQYKPTNAKNPNTQYISINDPKFKKEIIEEYKRLFIDKKIRGGERPDMKVSENTYTTSGYGRDSKNIPNSTNAIGRHFISKGQDENGYYISYYDVFDQGSGSSTSGGGVGEALGLTKPFEIYDRIYIDPKTGNPLPIKQQGGNIPVSSNGVYDYPMQEVIVPTQDGKITMSQVNYPILGIDEYGNQQMMFPNQEYQYSGKIIHEIPQLKNYFNKR